MAFGGREVLKRHKAFKHSDKLFQCELCNKTFALVATLNWHKKVIHYEKLMYSCDVCEKIFTQISHLKEHFIRIHETVEKKFRCEHCDKLFSESYKLENHIMVHSGIRNHPCSLCEKSFRTNSEVISHFRRIHVFENKSNECSICKKTFSEKHHLKSHMNIHNENSKVECNECGLLISSMQNLKTHKRRVHLLKDIKNVKCDSCEKRFYDKALLVGSVKNHIHRMKQEYIQMKPY